MIQLYKINFKSDKINIMPQIIPIFSSLMNMKKQKAPEMISNIERGYN